MARLTGQLISRSKIRASAARFDRVRRRVVLELTNGVSIAIPITALPELVDANADELAEVDVIGAGNILHFEALDADYSIPALVAQTIGRSLAMKEMARVGGQAKTHAKAAAARENGKKGGRPRKAASA